MTSSRRSVLLAAWLGMLLFGTSVTVLGAILPSLIERFGLANAEAGSLFLYLNLGIFSGSLVFGPVVDRYGYRWMLLASSILLFVGMETIAAAGSIRVVSLALALIGFGGGLMNGGTSALVADMSTGGRGAGLSQLGVFFGLGAFGVPLTMGLLLDRFEYGVLVASAGFIAVVPVLAISLAVFPPPKHAQGFPLRQGLAMVRHPVLLTMGLLLFLQAGMEMTAGGWSAAYSRQVLGLSSGQAVVFLSVFWFGMMISRFVLGLVLKRMTPTIVLGWMMGTAFVGSILLVSAGSVSLAGLGLLLLGIGMAAGYPIVLSLVGDAFPQLSGTAFGIVMVMALFGGSLAPYATGWIGDLAGLRLSLILLPVGLMLQAGVLIRLLRGR